MDHHWDPCGTPNHSMDWVSHDISRMVDLVIELTPIFIFPLEFWETLVIGRVDRGAGRLHELSWYVGHVWEHWMIGVPWQEAVRGGGIDGPLDRALHGEDALPLMYWAWEPRMIGATTIFPLECMELDLSGPLGQVWRYATHHDRSTSKVADTLAHVGCFMVQGSMTVGSVFQQGAKGCNWVQLCAEGRGGTCLYARERRGVWLYVMRCDANHGDFGAFPLGKPLDEDNRHAIGYSSPKISDEVDEHNLTTSMGSCTPASLPHCLQAQRSWMLSLAAFIMSNMTCEACLGQLVGIQSIQRGTL